MNNQVTDLIIERELKLKKLISEGRTDEANNLLNRNLKLLCRITKLSELANFPIIITDKTLPDLAKLLNELKDGILFSKCIIEKDGMLVRCNFNKEDIVIDNNHIKFVNSNNSLSIDVSENTNISYVKDILTFYEDNVMYNIYFTSDTKTSKIIDLVNRLIMEF